MTVMVVKGSEDTYFCGTLFSGTVTTESSSDVFEPTVMPQSDTIT